MSSLEISSIALVCVFGGALLGLALRTVLPEGHLNADTKDAVKVGMSLVATMAALVLGLLVAAAKSSYDQQRTEMTDMSSKIVLLDRLLAHYGPETQEQRNLLRNAATRILDQTWAKNSVGHLEPPATGGEVLYEKLQALTPKDESQRSLKAQAVTIATGIGTNALVDVRTNSRTGLRAVAHRADSVAHHDLHQLRPPGTCQPHGRRQLFRRRAGGFERDPLDPGDVLSLLRTASHLQHHLARSHRATWPVTIFLNIATT